MSGRNDDRGLSELLYRVEEERALVHELLVCPSSV